MPNILSDEPNQSESSIHPSQVVIPSNATKSRNRPLLVDYKAAQIEPQNLPPIPEDDPIRYYARLLIKRVLEDHQKQLLKLSDQNTNVKA